MSDLEARIARGEAAFERGELATARELLLECAEDPEATDPQRAQALSDLAVLAASQSRPDVAENYLLRALACDTTYLAALENLGHLCVTRGDLVQATHWLQRAAETSPDAHDARSPLAAVLRERRRDDLAGQARIAVPARGDIQTVERVLIVCDWFFPSVGGTEKLAEAVGVALQREGMTVEVAARPMESRVSREHRGMNIHELHGDPGASLGALVAAGSYDAVLAFSNAMVWPVLATLRLPAPRPRIVAVPCVNAMISAELRANSEVLQAYARLIAGADVIGYSSRAGYDVRLWEDLGLPGVYIPNAIERVLAAPVSPADALADEAPLLLVVANMWPEKNHVGLLQALRARKGDWRLGLIGNASPDHPELAQQVARLAEGDRRVELLGPATPEAVAAAMDQASILLLPSLAEATPLVLLEAMSRELPWIATPTCGAAHD
ncbi:MAG TPA: glycosyltransferase, partial [Solirubrobacteraceae bacterium]|nr:glycosyltransferase [Solirubrobacteraceae bacterium]